MGLKGTYDDLWRGRAKAKRATTYVYKCIFINACDTDFPFFHSPFFPLPTGGDANKALENFPARGERRNRRRKEVVVMLVW